MNYYIADTHFGHDNIRRLSNRPFKTIEEMDRTIIDNWNSRVSDNDDVYILGDFSYKSEDPISYLKQLNGRKHLIIGNHDLRLLKNSACEKFFVEICDMKMVNDYEKKLEYARNNTNLPDNPDYKRINEFVASVNERVVKGEV